MLGLHRAALPFALLIFLVGVDVPTAPPVDGRFEREAVATDHPQASAVAADILARGGSAADAAAAAMLALGVASPASSGFGGGGFALYYRAADRSTTFLDFRETAPAASTPDMFERAEAERPGSRPSELGGLATGVPGEPAGIEALVRRFGRLTLAQVAQPAIRMARRGVSPSPYILRQTPASALRDLGRDRALRSFLRDGALTSSSRFRQPGLARALTTFASRGAVGIYRGGFARRMVADIRARGGIVTLADLAAYRVREREPLRERHFGFDWVTAPPTSAGGATLLASLDFLERVGVSASTPSADFAHALVESWKGPYLDRQSSFGDPDHVDVPLTRLASPERRAARARLFEATRAIPASAYALPLEPTQQARTPDGGGTSHLCVVDREGNVASITTTVNLWFGARYTAAGVLMNDEMDDFARSVGAPNAFGLVGGARNLPGPGRRPVSSMSPTLVFGADGTPVLCIGAAGGSRIPTATEQVALEILVRGSSPETAIAAPRIHHQAMPESVYTERWAPMPPATLAALATRGHVPDLVDNVAIVQLVRILPGGALRAAADPRKGGQAAGR